jgi:hypothetical protein
MYIAIHPFLSRLDILARSEMEQLPNSLNRPRQHFLVAVSPLTMSSFPPTTPRLGHSESPSISQMRNLLPSPEDSATQRVAAIDREVEEEMLQSAARNNKRLPSINSLLNNDDLDTYTPTKYHGSMRSTSNYRDSFGRMMETQFNSLAHTDDDKENKAEDMGTKNMDDAKRKKIKKVCCNSCKFLSQILMKT